RERHDLRRFGGIIHNIAEISEGIVMLFVIAYCTSQISRRWEIFCIHLPHLSGGREFTREIVSREWSGKVVVVSLHCAGCECEMVSDGRTCIRVVLCGQ